MNNEEKQTNTEPEPLNIYQRINAVMGEASYVRKDGNGPKGLPYKSVSHDTVTAKLRGPMQTHGIVMLSDIVELKQDGNRTEVKMAISFVNIDNPADRVVVHFFGHGVDNQDKGIGKAISYAIKYCLLKTFLLESGTEDDVESHNIDHKPEDKVPISAKHLADLEALISGHDNIKQIILGQCGGNLSNLTTDQYPNAMKWVKNIIEKEKKKHD